MLKKYYATIVLWVASMGLAWAKKTGGLHPAHTFTRLMMVSFVIILGLWGLVWWRRRK